MYWQDANEAFPFATAQNFDCRWNDGNAAGWRAGDDRYAPGTSGTGTGGLQLVLEICNSSIVERKTLVQSVLLGDNKISPLIRNSLVHSLPPVFQIPRHPVYIVPFN